MLVAVKFTRSWRAYNAGEIAGFSPAIARELVSSEAAVPLSLEDLKSEKARAKQEATVHLSESRKKEIAALDGHYQDWIDKLDPKKDKAQIKKLKDEKDLMGRLISESKG
jgi:hypothetical protein